ncbi:unnamed protein product [Auanema sp. JU1783]|nr:unnamed protein product [Auanema sp. JU1783]
MNRFLLFSLLVLGTDALLRSPSLLRRKIFDNDAATADPYPQVQTLWFDQIVDHNDMTSNATWKQKYYYNPTFSKKNDIVFLMIGGEGPESKKWTGKEDIPYLTWAKELGADVFDLEHRFFGDSYPTKDMSTQSLRLLTIEQALADLAYFIEAMNIKMGYKKPQWVTFGGSYPGALSAWFRQKYPTHTVGAVASSAPINLKLDFFEYAMVVSDDLMITDPVCAKATRDAYTLIQQLTLTAAGRNTLNKELKLSPPFAANVTKLDINNLFGNLFNVFQGMTQYTYDGQRNATINQETDRMLCQFMTGNGTLLNRIYKLNTFFDALEGATDDSFQNSYSASIIPVSTGNLTLLGPDLGAARGWMWLCCNQVGYMQTTDQGDNIFGSTVPLNLFINMCVDMFGTDMRHLFDGNTKTQNYFGGADYYTATNIILPNGSLDPWHALGFYGNVSATTSWLLINGTAHCSDMYPPYNGEPAALPAARATIKNAVFSFITPVKSASFSLVSCSILLVLLFNY